jgi:hypothetical protein
MMDDLHIGVAEVDRDIDAFIRGDLPTDKIVQLRRNLGSGNWEMMCDRRSKCIGLGDSRTVIMKDGAS